MTDANAEPKPKPKLGRPKGSKDKNPKSPAKGEGKRRAKGHGMKAGRMSKPKESGIMAEDKTWHGSAIHDPDSASATAERIRSEIREEAFKAEMAGRTPRLSKRKLPANDGAPTEEPVGAPPIDFSPPPANETIALTGPTTNGSAEALIKNTTPLVHDVGTHEEMNDRHARIAFLGQRIAEVELERVLNTITGGNPNNPDLNRPPVLELAEVRKLADSLVKLERVVVGEPTEVIEVREVKTWADKVRQVVDAEARIVDAKIVGPNPVKALKGKMKG